MANRIIDDIKESFRQGSSLTKLIYINLGFFLFVKIAYVIFFLITPEEQSLIYGSRDNMFNRLYLEYLMYPSNLNKLLYRPWTILTYMFLHFKLGHIIMNLIGLFWFGRLYLEYFNQKQLTTTYLIGGFFGALLYTLFAYSFPGVSKDVPMLGASAAIMAIIIAVIFYIPNKQFYFPFIGQIKLKYIGLVYLIIDVIFIASDNSGGHISHLGGALYGSLFALQMKKGKDPGKGFSAFVDGLATAFKRKPKMRVTYKSQASNMNDLDYNKSKSDTQKEVDKILDKIAKSGYDSLSKREKEILFKMSDKK